MKSALLTGLLSSAAIAASLNSVNPIELKIMRDKGVPIIDIRTPAEWKTTGIIKGAHKMMFFDEKGQPQMGEWMFNLGRLIKDKNKPFVIYCAHANRTKSLGNWLVKQMGFTSVNELEGGIEYGWIDKKEPTVK